VIDEELVALYWDASAILSALIQDIHSEKAQQWAQRPGVHLISTLSYAEVLAVLERVRRERIMASVLVDAALETLKNGPWRLLNFSPPWQTLLVLSKKWSLRGADLWHIAAAKSIRDQLPELELLTFDDRLHAAAEGEGISI
jgi:predicted nucleic acid-binding protein